MGAIFGWLVNSATISWNQQNCRSLFGNLRQVNYFLRGRRKVWQRRHVRWTTATASRRQSNFVKRRGGKLACKDAVGNCRLLFCYILTPITVLIEAVSGSMGKVVQIQSLLFVQLLLKLKPIIWYFAFYFRFPCNDCPTHRVPTSPCFSSSPSCHHFLLTTLK